MEKALESLEIMFHFITQIGILLIEFVGAVILICTTLKSVYGWLRHNETMRLYLAQGIALALEFKMGGEVLRTVIVRDWSELIILGAVVVLRGLLALLIHWEIKNEEERLGN